jgi:hypothetical protein
LGRCGGARQPSMCRAPLRPPYIRRAPSLASPPSDAVGHSPLPSIAVVVNEKMGSPAG